MSEIRWLRQRVLNMVARGVLAQTDDEIGMQQQQLSLLYEEDKVAVERFQNYGFTGSAPADSECLVVFVGGGRDHGVVVAVDDRQSRFTGLAPGEVAVYTNEGDSIVLKRGNLIEIVTKEFTLNAEETISLKAQTLVEIEAPAVNIKGSDGTTEVEIDGNLHVTGVITSGDGGR